MIRPLLFAAALTGAAPAATAGDIVIAHPWARATPPGARTGAAYMTLTNRGTRPDTLLGGSTPVAASFELHESSMAGGVMRMRPLVRGVVVAPGATVRIAPGGMHVMLMGLNRPLIAGQAMPATLRFARAGVMRVSFSVER